MSKGHRTKAALMDAAEALFQSEKIQKVTVHEITNSAGVAKGTFYIYFESKDELVWQLIESRVEKLTELFADVPNLNHSTADINALIDFIIDFIKENKHFFELIHQAKFSSFLGADTVERKYINNWSNYLSQWIRMGVRLKRLDDLDPDFTAAYIVVSFHDFLERILLDELPYSMEEARTHLKQLMVKMLRRQNEQL